MKKYIKTFFIIIFIILVLGTTASKAAQTKETKSDLTQLESDIINGKSRNITSTILYDQNNHIFCRNHIMSIGSNTMYQKENDQPITYPGTHENGYAIAYILSGSRNGYIKENIQMAYWKILGYDVDNWNNSDAQKLYNIATTYQSFKQNETDVIVNTNTAELEYIDYNTAVYGPIKIQYNYQNSQEAHFGGFYYAFFDSSDNNISDKVSLCTKEGSTYNDIISTKVSDKTLVDYESYQVKTVDYNNVNLYVKINIKEINNSSNIKMKIQKNTLDISAKVYQLKGEEKVEAQSATYCEKCRLKGPGYYCAVCGTTSYNKNAKPRERLNDGIKHFANAHFTKMGGMSGWVTYKCNGCGDLVSDKGKQTSNREEHAAQHIQLKYGCRKKLLWSISFSGHLYSPTIINII